MASFWGVQVKPKRPFMVQFEDLEGPPLHLTQATLGSNITKERTILKCKVGDGPAVFLCSLLPGVVETCSLNLCFREDVVFSVKGSTSVHLAGYYDHDDAAEDQSEDSSDEDGFARLQYDDEDSMDDRGDDESEDPSNEDQRVMFSNSGVKIVEIMDEDPSEQLTDTLLRCDGEGIALKGRNIMKSKQQEANNSSGVIEDKNDTDGPKQFVKEDQTKNLSSHKDSADEHSVSSEDEDGFTLTCKRKPEEAGGEMHSKRRSLEVPMPEPLDVQDKHEKTTGAEKVTKKAKKKKKKKKDGKISLEHQDVLPLSQGNGSAQTPFSQGAGKSNRKEGDDASVVDGEIKSSGKKGFVRKYPNGLEVENVSMGTPDGKQAKPGNKVGMLYIGKLKANGKIFDSNIGRKAFEFRLGVGEVIKGWDIGVNGMRVGDKRRLTIPPAMGYGQKGVSGIPPNSWLLFDVELVHVK